jgi:hypothetical protein
MQEQVRKDSVDLKTNQTTIEGLTRTVVSQNDMLSTDIMGGGTVRIEPGSPPNTSTDLSSVLTEILVPKAYTMLMAKSLSRFHIYNLALLVRQPVTKTYNEGNSLLRLTNKKVAPSRICPR